MSYSKPLNAQVGLYDALIFFIIMVIVAAAFYVTPLLFLTGREVELKGHHVDYVKLTLPIILQATIRETTYTFVGDTTPTTLTNKTIAYLLLFDVWGRHDETIQVTDGKVETLESDITKTLRDIISWKYSFVLQVSYTEGDNPVNFQLTDDPEGAEKLPAERYSAHGKLKMIGELPGEVDLTLILWLKYLS